MDLISGLKKPLKNSVVIFLRSQQCGFEEGFPKVCCAVLPKTLPVLKGKSTTTEKPTARPKRVFINLSAVIEQGQDTDQNKEDVKVWELFDVKHTSSNSDTSKSDIRTKNTTINNLALMKFYEDLSTFDLFRRRRDNNYIEIR